MVRPSASSRLLGSTPRLVAACRLSTAHGASRLLVEVYSRVEWRTANAQSAVRASMRRRSGCSRTDDHYRRAQVFAWRLQLLCVCRRKREANLVESSQHGG